MPRSNRHEVGITAAGNIQNEALNYQLYYGYLENCYHDEQCRLQYDEIRHYLMIEQCSNSDHSDTKVHMQAVGNLAYY